MIVLQMDPGATAAEAMRTLKQAAADHPGEHRLTVKSGARTLALGDVWSYSGSPSCLAKLGQFGTVRVLASSETP